jgi:hypothetical protein
MITPTLRFVSRASSGTMFSRVHGPPTSRATRAASSGPIEHQDEGEVPIVDPGDVSRTATGIHDTPDRVVRLLDDLRRRRVTQVEMVHDDVR